MRLAFILGLAASASALAIGSAGAQNFWLKNGVPVKDLPPNMASADPFAVQQIATNDPDKLMADWLKPGAGVVIPGATTTIARNKPIVTFIVFTGCKADPAGKCNVTADFETTDPSGKVYDITKGAEVWVGKPPPPALGLQLSVGGLGLVVENKDPVGSYTVHATVTDHVAGKTLRTQQILTATP